MTTEYPSDMEAISKMDSLSNSKTDSGFPVYLFCRNADGESKKVEISRWKPTFKTQEILTTHYTNNKRTPTVEIYSITA